MNLEYLKKNISPITKIDPPYYWRQMNLWVVGDGIVDLPDGEELSGLRVMIVKGDTTPRVAFNSLILGGSDVQGLEWYGETEV
jgi:hypothetical protein